MLTGELNNLLFPAQVEDHLEVKMLTGELNRQFGEDF